MMAITRRDQVGRVAEQLERQLREERADASDEVRRRVRAVGREEPDRIARLVGDQRDQPDQAQREQRNAQKLAEAARQRRLLHVRSPSGWGARAAAGRSAS